MMKPNGFCERHCEPVNVTHRIKPDQIYYRRLVNGLKNLDPVVKIIAGGEKFWLEYVPRNLGTFNLKTSDAVICCYVEFLNINIFHSFDEQLMQAVGRKS